MKSDIAVIEDVGVKIGHADSRSAGAHKPVERLVHEHIHAELQLMRQIFSQRALTGGRVVGRADAGEKQEVIVAERVGRQDHQIGGLKNFLAGFVEVRNAPRSSAIGALFVHDAAHGDAGTQRYAFRFCTTGR